MVLMSVLAKIKKFFVNYVAGAFFIVTILGCSWALLHSGMFRIHDYTHAARIAELLRAAQDGHFPVRWSSNFGFGYGMPLFEFYAPLPFYVGALFYWLGTGLVPAVKLLFLICSILTFVGMYKLGSRLFGHAGGLLSAVAFTLAPYRAVNLFVRGDLGEAWGMMALPWVLLGVVRIIRREKGGWVTLVFGLVTLFLSHNITTLIFLPFSALFALGYFAIEKYRQRSPIIRELSFVKKFSQNFQLLFFLGLIYVLAIGMAAFYLFPAFFEKDLTNVNGIFQGYFRYENHFVYLRQFFTPFWGYGGSQPGPEDGLSFFLGYGQLLGVVVAILLAVRYKWRRLCHFRQQLRQHEFLSNFFSPQLMTFVLFAVLTSLALFMCVQHSEFIWHQIPLMVAIQFPWRWLSVADIFLALLIGSATLFINTKPRRYLFVFALSLFILATATPYFQPENFQDVSHAFYYGDPQRIRHDMSKTLNDYIPAQMKLDPKSKELLPIDVPFVVTTGDPKEVTQLVNHVQEKLFQTNFKDPGKIELPIANFPGWATFLDGKKVPTSQADLGNIVLNVPAGNHLVGVQFLDTPIRSWSDIASALSWIILLYLLLWQASKNH